MRGEGWQEKQEVSLGEGEGAPPEKFPWSGPPPPLLLQQPKTLSLHHLPTVTLFLSKDHTRMGDRLKPAVFPQPQAWITSTGVHSGKRGVRTLGWK